MVTQYKTVAREVKLEESAKRLKLSPTRCWTVASIIEKEVNRPEDRPKVARVIYNRLAKDMKLQMDSTVTYAENLTGTTTSAKQRKSRSPYNTYRYKGLPPGPIAAPGGRRCKRRPSRRRASGCTS
jgi:UPF0755 protein